MKTGAIVGIGSIAVLVLALELPASAASMSRPARQQTADAQAKVPLPDQDRLSSKVSAAPVQDRPCPSIRRRIWSPRDGWIVRRVPACD